MPYCSRSALKVKTQLADFIENEALPCTGVGVDQFWDGLAALVGEAGPRNRELLARRDDLQKKIDAWHKENGPVASDPDGYRVFLDEIGYLVAEPEDFTINTGPMDEEISTLCGPQLVVPVSNARYALNAANARWGSLFDALYGTDAIDRAGDLAPGKEYNPKRGKEVFARAAAYLDQAFPLISTSHADIVKYSVDRVDGVARLSMETEDAKAAHLVEPAAFAGFRVDGEKLVILLSHHGVHMELIVDPSGAIGASHKAGLADIIVEAALTTIQDCEDSVAAVDVTDKIGVYRNWLGLMKGDLADSFEKNGKHIERRLNPDRSFSAPDGSPLKLKGRALQLVRNVGHLMTSDMVLDGEGKEVGEGIIDAAITSLCALHDLRKTSGIRNSTNGSIYIVKPKMHGPDEVGLACDIFAGVEKMLGLRDKTIKIGIMDEERRTSANLKAAIYQARERLFFINTGFLDRTGDEIHTSLYAGPVPPKADIKAQPWLMAYEDRNVLIGLSCALSGKAQIGKGMWAMPDDMADMLAQKGAQPAQGANCAWVPSPTAATLHMLHYHQTDVFAAQKRRHNEKTPGLDQLFSLSVIDPTSLSEEQIMRELDNNAQGILGYVVRWINQGVGCSKVPDINNVGLMEDRATLRISSQHIANWLLHEVVSRDQVVACFKRMAKVVDGQNAADPLYEPMADDFDNSIAFQAALELALEGANQPSGYTEPILHRRRRERKAQL
ncbi:Malate synthase G [hydrothermal vent metagenome]|uniref:Malate synthase G n=1 Tax=hydrothermal vent metagenome TaxID=652676 RepID=A0A3B0UTL6_9ZZZZ